MFWIIFPTACSCAASKTRRAWSTSEFAFGISEATELLLAWSNALLLKLLAGPQGCRLSEMQTVSLDLHLLLEIFETYSQQSCPNRCLKPSDFSTPRTDSFVKIDHHWPQVLDGF